MMHMTYRNLELGFICVLKPYSLYVQTSKNLYFLDRTACECVMLIYKDKAKFLQEAVTRLFLLKLDESTVGVQKTFAQVELH